MTANTLTYADAVRATGGAVAKCLRTAECQRNCWRKVVTLDPGTTWLTAHVGDACFESKANYHLVMEKSA